MSMASHQKLHIEKNHEYIHFVLQKGKSFDQLTQDKITLMMNHINSAAKTRLNRQTPFEQAELILDKLLLEALSLELVPPDKVVLKPALRK